MKYLHRKLSRSISWHYNGMLRDLRYCRRLPEMDLQEVGGGCEDWMELAQNRDRWRALVSTVMNLGVPKMRGIS